MPADDESRRRRPSSEETQATTLEDREERIEAANRAAEKAGMPGVNVPEAPTDLERRTAAAKPQDRTPTDR